MGILGWMFATQSIDKCVSINKWLKWLELLESYIIISFLFKFLLSLSRSLSFPASNGV